MRHYSLTKPCGDRLPPCYYETEDTTTSDPGLEELTISPNEMSSSKNWSGLEIFGLISLVIIGLALFTGISYLMYQKLKSLLNQNAVPVAKVLEAVTAEAGLPPNVTEADIP